MQNPRYYVEGYDVLDRTTNSLIDSCPNRHDAEVMALALNRVEELANQYVVVIMASIAAEGDLP